MHTNIPTLSLPIFYYYSNWIPIFKNQVLLLFGNYQSILTVAIMSQYQCAFHQRKLPTEVIYKKMFPRFLPLIFKPGFPPFGGLPHDQYDARRPFSHFTPVRKNLWELKQKCSAFKWFFGRRGWFKTDILFKFSDLHCVFLNFP